MLNGKCVLWWRPYWISSAHNKIKFDKFCKGPSNEYLCTVLIQSKSVVSIGPAISAKQFKMWMTNGGRLRWWQTQSEDNVSPGALV